MVARVKYALSNDDDFCFVHAKGLKLDVACPFKISKKKWVPQQQLISDSQVISLRPIRLVQNVQTSNYASYLKLHNTQAEKLTVNRKEI